MTIPQRLYKYLPPLRLDVLTKSRIRVSQKEVVNDTRDFDPVVSDFAPLDRIHQMLSAMPGRELRPASFDGYFLKLCAYDKGIRELILEKALQNRKAPYEYGMISLCATFDSAVMWDRYAQHGTGFLIELDMAKLNHTGYIRQITYTDEAVPYFTDLNAGSFFMKGTEWEDEKEWRIVRRLSLCVVDGGDDGGHPLYFLGLPPRSITRILYLATCTVANELSQLAAVDARYRNVSFLKIDLPRALAVGQ